MSGGGRAEGRVKFAEVVVVLLDARRSPFETRDLRIGPNLAEREGRAGWGRSNKWDLETDKQGRLTPLRQEFERLLPPVERRAAAVLSRPRDGARLDPVGRGGGIGAHAVWNRRVPTAGVNLWLGGDGHGASGRPLRADVGSSCAMRPQGEKNPATGLRCHVLASGPACPNSYKRYLSEWPQARFRHAMERRSV